MKIQYVSGLIFKDQYVALIEKLNGPKQFIGKLNAPGGKVNHREPTLSAMRREIKEECDLTIFNWQYFLHLADVDWEISWYTCQYNGNFSDLKSNEIEQVNWYEIDYILYKNSNRLVPNLKWIIPLALDNSSISSVFYS